MGSEYTAIDTTSQATLPENNVYTGEIKMKKKNTNNLSKAITIRITNDDYQNMIKQAEENCMGVPDIVRKAWRDFLLQQDIKSSLSQLEQRLTRRNFEIVVAVANLNDQERLIAMKTYKSKLRLEKK